MLFQIQYAVTTTFERATHIVLFCERQYKKGNKQGREEGKIGGRRGEMEEGREYLRRKGGRNKEMEEERKEGMKLWKKIGR